MIVAGIDGGGTHTRVELRDEKNGILKHGLFGPFNMAALGEADFRRRMREMIHFCGDIADVRALCIGGAGSSGTGMESVVREELSAAGYHGKLKFCGDHEIALYGALEGPGVILIAGTGSICCGRNAAGEIVRCGGWGHLLDDPGSAYAIGREALSAALRTEDGRLPGNAVHTKIMEKLHAESARDLVTFAYYSGAGKTEIASLAPIVIHLATCGDPFAQSILESQAAELVNLAQTAAARLKLENPNIVLLGGMLETDSWYSTNVREKVQKFAQIRERMHDAVWGAAQIAYNMAVEQSPLG